MVVVEVGVGVVLLHKIEQTPFRAKWYIDLVYSLIRGDQTTTREKGIGAMAGRAAGTKINTITSSTVTSWIVTTVVIVSGDLLLQRAIPPEGRRRQ